MIQLVIHALTTRKPLHGSQRLIIDYQGPPIAYSKDGEAILSETLVPLGEADVKFVRYCDMFRNLQVDSVDGDCVPIALLKLEAGHIGNITILRIETKLKEDKPKLSGTKRGKPEKDTETPNRCSANQRFGAFSTRSMSETQRASTHPTTTQGEQLPEQQAVTKNKQIRVYEYVHINKIYSDLCNRIIPNRKTVEPKMSMLSTLICLTGTDFSRHLPLIGPNTLFNQLDNIWRSLESCYDKESGQLVVGATADVLISKIYNLKFANHTTAADLPGIMQQLHLSKLSDKTKQALPTLQDVRVTIRNINWVIQYWRMQTYPDPVQDKYGFTRTAKGATTYCTE